MKVYTNTIVFLITLQFAVIQILDLDSFYRVVQQTFVSKEKETWER